MKKTVVLAIAYTFSLAHFFHPHATLAAIDQKATVTVEIAQKKQFSDILSYPGRVRSRVNAVKNSEIEGQVVQIARSLGARVKTGDVIMVLQNTDPVYRFAPIKVRSEANGFLTTLDTTLMSRVERGQKLFTITDPQNLLIEIEVPASDLASLRVGIRGEYKIDSLSDKTVDVEIVGLSPLIDINSGTATAQLMTLAKTGALMQGQLGRVSIKTNLREAFVLPDSAIIYRDDKPCVRVVENGKSVKKEIQLGRRVGDNFEVVSGLANGEQIISRTNRFVADGEVVEVQKANEKL